MDKFDSAFGELCVKKGFVSFTQLKECLDIQSKLVEMGLEPKPLSEILIEKKLMKKEQVEEVLKTVSTDGAPSESAPAGSKPTIKNEYEFGELAIKEGLITFDQLKECLDIQYQIRNLGYEPKPLDEILIDRKYMTRHQVETLKSTGGKPKEQTAPRVESRLGEIAVKKKFISKEQLEECLLLQARSRDPGQKPRKLGEILVEKGYITADQLDELLIQSAKAPAPFEIPGFEIVSKIGLGGMGAVYKARQVSIGREVAIKVLFPKYTKDREYMNRFLREAQLLAKMSHPNIVLAIDAGQVRGVPYFVMEFIDGISVSELLEHKGKLPERDCLKIGMHVARALQHAFKHKLVHRDIKPQNIMITKDGLVKVCDLGIAKRTDVKDDLHLTSEGMAIGTPYYMSPEAALGREVDIRADIYSLGATLYHLATGIPPFDSNSPAAILAMHVNETLVPPKKRNPHMTDGFNEMLLKMMRKNPMERYQTPADVAQVMEDMLRHKPGIPTQPVPPHQEQPSQVIQDRSTKRVTRREAVIEAQKSMSKLVAVIIFLLVAAVFILAYMLMNNAFGPKTSHNPPPTHNDTPPISTPSPTTTPPPPPVSKDPSPLEREHRTRVAEMNVLKERIEQAKPEDEFIVVYNAYADNVMRFRGTDFSKHWVDERDAYVESANQRADNIWQTFRTKSEGSEQLGEVGKAIETLEAFPKALRFVGPNIPSRAELERRQRLAALNKKAGASIADYQAKARQAMDSGDFKTAWGQVQELELFGGIEQAKALRPQILEKQYAQVAAPPLTRAKVESLYTLLDSLKSQSTKDKEFQAEIARRRQQIDMEFEQVLALSRQKFVAYHQNSLHPEFEKSLKNRDYVKIGKAVAAAFQSPDYAALLQSSDIDHAMIGSVAGNPKATPEQIGKLLTAVEVALGSAVAAGQTEVQELLFDLWSSVLLRELMHMAAQGILKLATDRKETIGTFSHPQVAGGRDFRVKLAAVEGVAVEIVKVSGTAEVGGTIYFSPKKSGSWNEADIAKLASFGKPASDPWWEARLGLLYYHSDKASEASAYFKRAKSSVPAIQAYLDQLKAK
jgi:serine/threonine-protein kinase